MMFGCLAQILTLNGWSKSSRISKIGETNSPQNWTKLRINPSILQLTLKAQRRTITFKSTWLSEKTRLKKFPRMRSSHMTIIVSVSSLTISSSSRITLWALMCSWRWIQRWWTLARETIHKLQTLTGSNLHSKLIIHRNSARERSPKSRARTAKVGPINLSRM